MGWAQGSGALQEQGVGVGARGVSDSRDAEICRQAAEFIAHHEGCLLHAYPDPASPLGRALKPSGVRRIGNGASIPAEHAALSGDPWTIGYGQTGPAIKFGVQWDAEQAKAALAAECMARWRAIQNLVTVSLSISQAVALISFVYNLGVGAFEKSTLRSRINAHDFAGAAAEFGKWVKAGGEVMPGLVTRRACERALFESGSDAARPGVTIIGGA